MSRPFGQGATAKAVLLMTGSTYVSFFFGLVVSAIIARGLGPREFGQYAYVVWLSGLLVLFANNGLTTTGIRFISESLGRDNASAASDVHGWLLRWQFASLVVVAGLFALSSVLWPAANWSGSPLVFVGVILLSAICKTFYLFDISVAKGHGQFRVEAASTVIVSAINLLGVVLLFALNATLTAYLVFFAATSVGYWAMAFRMRRAGKILATNEVLDEALSTSMKSHLLWTVILALASALSNKSAETYLLNAWVGPAEVGFFAIGAALTRGGVELLASGVNSVLMPLMAHGYGQGGTTRVHAILSDSLRLYGFAGLLLAGVGFMWADVAVWLAYGDKFQDAANVFRVMIMVAGMTLSQSAFGALLSTTDKQHVRAGVAITSVLVSAAMAFLLVPRFGLNGAVIAHAVSSSIIYIAICVGMVKAFSVTLPLRELSRLFLAAAVAAVPSGALLWLGSSVFLQFFAGVVFVVFYLVGTLVFRAWRPDDIARLNPLARRYPRALGRALPALERWVSR